MTAIRGSEATDFRAILNVESAYVAEAGRLVCKPSRLDIVVMDDVTDKPCDQYTVVSDCRPPQENFPYCECKPGVITRTPYDVVYNRRYSRANPTGSGSVNVYCFSVKVNQSQCATTPRCCGMELNKVEWLSDETKCQQAVAGWQVSTVPAVWRQPVWSREDDNSTGSLKTYGVLKTNELGLTVANGNNVEICIALRASGACPTMERFCYAGSSTGCKYAIFDRSGGAGCCSTDYAPGNFGVYSRRLSL